MYKNVKESGLVIAVNSIARGSGCVVFWFVPVNVVGSLMIAVLWSVVWMSSPCGSGAQRPRSLLCDCCVCRHTLSWIVHASLLLFAL